MRQRSGNAIIEMAVVFPVLMWVGMGIVEFGQYFYYKNVFEEAARDAGRAALMKASANGDPQAAAARVFAGHNIPFNSAWVIIYDITPFSGVLMTTNVTTTSASAGDGHALQVMIQTTYDQIPGVVRPLNAVTGQGIKTGKVISGQATVIRE